MKEKALKRIHRVGKIGSFFTILAKIVIILGMVASIVGAVACSVLPEDLFTVDFGGEAQVTLNVDTIKKVASSTDADDIEKMAKQLSKEGKIYVNGQQYVVSNVSKDGKKLNIETGAKLPSVINMTTIRNILAVTAIYLIVILISLSSLSKLCKAIKRCSSPFEDNVVKRLKKFSYTLWPWVILNSALSSVMSYLMGNGSTMNIRINFSMLGVVLAVCGIISVFKYGAMIQQGLPQVSSSDDVINPILYDINEE